MNGAKGHKQNFHKMLLGNDKATQCIPTEAEQPGSSPEYVEASPTPAATTQKLSSLLMPSPILPPASLPSFLKLAETNKLSK